MLQVQSGLIFLMVGPTAPASYASNVAAILSLAAGTSIVNYEKRNQIALPFPVRLPAGYGIWIAGSAAGGGVDITYDLVG